MDGGKCDSFNSTLEDFLREFGCDDSSREHAIDLMKVGCRGSKDDVKKCVERAQSKIMKRHPARAVEFAALIQQIRRSDLRYPDDVVAFLILRNTAEKRHRTAGRQDKLEAANANSSFSTPSSFRSFSRGLTQSAHRAKTASKLRCSATNQLYGLKCEALVTPPRRTLDGRTGGAPSVVSEEQMQHPVLSALLGIEGRYITRSGDSEGDLSVDKSCALEDTVHAQLLRIIPLGNYYSRIRKVAERKSSDLIAQAFFSCLSELMAEYGELVAQLNSMFTKYPNMFSMRTVISFLHEWETVLPLIIELSSFSEGIAGMRIFNALFSVYCNSVPTSLVCHVLEHALKSVLTIFHENLRQWLVCGQLSTQVSEWMIVPVGSATVESAWTTGYKVLKEAVPVIFENCEHVVEKILVTGKSVRLLRSLGAENGSLDERRRLFSMIDPSKTYLDVKEAMRFSHILNRLYRRVSSDVLLEVMEKFHVREHAETVQKHFFLTDECLAFAFYEQLCLASEGDLKKVDSQCACMSFKTAIAACSSVPLEVRKMARIEATCGLMEESGEIVPSPRIDGAPTIQLQYIATEPISIIFSESVMGRYQRAFEIIWPLICTHFQIISLAEEHAGFVNGVTRIWPELTRLFRLCSVLFSRINHFLITLRSYIINVILHSTRKFSLELERDTCGDLDKVIEAHAHYMDAVENGIFLSDDSVNIRTTILTCLNLISQTIVEYYDFKAKVEKEKEAKVLFARSVENCALQNLQDTAQFELVEESIRLDAVAGDLIASFRPCARNAAAKFEMLVRDMLCELSTLDHKSFLALSLQLNFAMQC